MAQHIGPEILDRRYRRYIRTGHARSERELHLMRRYLRYDNAHIVRMPAILALKQMRDLSAPLDSSKIRRDRRNITGGACRMAAPRALSGRTQRIFATPVNPSIPSINVEITTRLYINKVTDKQLLVYVMILQRSFRLCLGAYPPFDQC